MPTVLPRLDSGASGHDVLRQRGRQADHQAGNQQHLDGWRSGCQQQGQAQNGRFAQDDAPAVKTIAQRGQQNQAQRIAQLGERGDQANGGGRGAKFTAQHAQHGLRVVQGRGGQAGAGSQQQHQATGQACGSLVMR